MSETQILIPEVVLLIFKVVNLFISYLISFQVRYHKEKRVGQKGLPFIFIIDMIRASFCYKNNCIINKLTSISNMILENKFFFHLSKLEFA